jgi:hypothetical protein
MIYVGDISSDCRLLDWRQPSGSGTANKVWHPILLSVLREFAMEQDVERHSAEKTGAFRKGVLRRMQGSADAISWR